MNPLPTLVDVIYNRSIPPELTTPYEIPNIDLSNVLLLQREKKKMSDHDDRMKTWRESRGYLISKIKESMTTSSLQRTQDVYPIEYEAAIKSDDVLKLLQLIETVNYSQSTHQQSTTCQEISIEISRITSKSSIN